MLGYSVNQTFEQGLYHSRERTSEDRVTLSTKISRKLHLTDLVLLQVQINTPGRKPVHIYKLCNKVEW